VVVVVVVVVVVGVVDVVVVVVGANVVDEVVGTIVVGARVVVLFNDSTVISCTKPIPLTGAYTTKLYLPAVSPWGRVPVNVAIP
jgi:hypothetical protein